MYLIVDYTAKDNTSFLYLALLNSDFEELVDFKIQIMQLSEQVDNIFATLNQSNPK